MEAAAYEYFRKIDELGGMVEAIKQNYPQREIADASFRYQCEVDEGGRIIVGVNRYHSEDAPLPILRIDPALERKQIDRLQSVRGRRAGEEVEEALGRLKGAAATDENLMDALLDCARVHASEGEIVEALQTVFGTYTETPVF
jgi:methylmalonyl-CoA mutase, N-terminal domain